MSSVSLPRLKVELYKLIGELANEPGSSAVTASGIAKALGVDTADALPLIYDAVREGSLTKIYRDQCQQCGRANGRSFEEGQSSGYADCGTCGTSPHDRYVFFKATDAVKAPKASRRRAPQLFRLLLTLLLNLRPKMKLVFRIAYSTPRKNSLKLSSVPRL